MNTCTSHADQNNFYKWSISQKFNTLCHALKYLNIFFQEYYLILIKVITGNPKKMYQIVILDYHKKDKQK